MSVNQEYVANADFWRNKRILVTGHTGFKGGWLAIWLNHLGAKVVGMALPPNTSPNLYSLAKLDSLCEESHFCDIRNAAETARLVKQTKPDIVFHLAAQPLVRASYRQPVETFATNVMGTVHLLDAIRKVDTVRATVLVTTDKVYRNREWPWPYREDDILGGHDPYSASKAASEIAIESYRKAFLSQQGVAVASARAGNVIGGGDWSEDRLIPDAIRAWQSGQSLTVRRPESVRPWQHVIEPLAGYMTLAKKLWDTPDISGAFNFGPDTSEAATVQQVISLAQKAYGNGSFQFGNAAEGPHEAGRLALEVAKAKTLLGVHSRWPLEKSVTKTLEWYRKQNDGADAYQLCLEDISAFEAGN